MILIDSNLLLYAYHASSEQYEHSRRWLEEVFDGPEPVGLPWATILAFLRLSTNPRIFGQPLSITEAVAIVTEWMTRPAVTIVHPGENHWEVLSALLPGSQVRAALVMDAHLAALAIEHGATLCTTDRDFARFPKLRTLNPLEGSG